MFMLGGLAFTAVNAAELTEAEKQALEAQLKAAELAKETAKKTGMTTTQTTTTTTAPVVAPEVKTATFSGRASWVNKNSITVGIIGENIFTVTPNTTILYNGKLERYWYKCTCIQPITLSNIYIGDKVSIEYNASTKEAVKIEAEGYWGPATYIGFSQVTYVGMIGHTLAEFGMIMANYAGIKLDPKVAEVTLNGAPATIYDIRVGDTISYVQSSVDGKAYFIKIFR